MSRMPDTRFSTNTLRDFRFQSQYKTSVESVQNVTVGLSIFSVSLMKFMSLTLTKAAIGSSRGMVGLGLSGASLLFA